MNTIVTKRGDAGYTDCLYGLRVPKSSLLIECIGTLDELNAWVGVSNKNESPDCKRWPNTFITTIHSNLIAIMGEISARPENFERYRNDFKKVVTEQDIKEVEEIIAKLEAHVNTNGWSNPCSFWDVACRVARRAERLLNKYHEQTPECRAVVLIYINRLADLLWLWGRE
jgi:cob(I)alamin adenosyltransferase